MEAMGARHVDAEMDRRIRTAIRGRRVVEFRLHGCRRVAEPHDYGIRGGEAWLLVFQTEGDSASGGLPNWRYAKVSQISELRVLERSFPGQRPTATGRHVHWDILFERVAEPDPPPGEPPEIPTIPTPGR